MYSSVGGTAHGFEFRDTHQRGERWIVLFSSDSIMIDAVSHSFKLDSDTIRIVGNTAAIFLTDTYIPTYLLGQLCSMLCRELMVDVNRGTMAATCG